MLKANRPPNSTCEQQAKFIQERIVTVEKHFSELCVTFGGYARKTASVRDKSDEAASVLHNYAESENINKSLKEGLYSFSSTLSVIGDHRDAEVRRLEAKVVSELAQYQAICKNARNEVKTTLTARDRELTRKRHLDRIKERNPRNKQQISQAESELMKASADVSRTVKALEEQIEVFEKKKLHDIRAVLLDYVTIELSFHAKAVEMFTKAYGEIANIDTEDDIEDFQLMRGNVDGEFCEALRSPKTASRLDTVKRTSFRNTSFTLSNLFSTPPAWKRELRSAPQAESESPPQQQSLNQSMDSMKAGPASSLVSLHVEDFMEDEDSSTDQSDDKYGRNGFCEALRSPKTASRLDTVKRTSFRNRSFSLSNLFSTPPAWKRELRSAPQAESESPPQQRSLNQSLDSMKAGPASSLASLHVEEFIEDEDSSTDQSDDKYGRNVRKSLSDVSLVPKM